MEQIPTQKPDAVEKVFMQLNLDTAYTVMYLDGHNPTNGRYLFQPQLKIENIHTETGYNIEPITDVALSEYANLLRQGLAEQGIDATVTIRTYPAAAIEILVTKD
jgi:hypothetical protein